MMNLPCKFSSQQIEMTCFQGDDLLLTRVMMRRAHQLRERGWVVPAYTMAPHSEKMKMIRVVVREDFTKSRCDALLADFKLALQTLDQLDAKKIQENKE